MSRKFLIPNSQYYNRCYYSVSYTYKLKTRIKVWNISSNLHNHSYDVALLINAILKLQSSVGNIYIYHGKAHFLLFLVL